MENSTVPFQFAKSVSNASMVDSTFEFGPTKAVLN